MHCKICHDANDIWLGSGRRLWSQFAVLYIFKYKQNKYKFCLFWDRRLQQFEKQKFENVKHFHFAPPLSKHEKF